MVETIGREISIYISIGMKSEALPFTIEIIDVDFYTVVSAVERGLSALMTEWLIFRSQGKR